MPKRRRFRRSLQRLFRPGRKIGHTAKGIAYHVGNSFRGLRWQKLLGYPWSDRDLQMDKQGQIHVTHWGRPLRHGFVDPLGELDRNTRVRAMTTEQVARLRAPGGYRIHTIWADIDAAAKGKRKIGLYLEPKNTDARWRDTDLWRRVKSYADERHVPLRAYALPANAACLPFIRGAGIPAKKIGRR